MIESIMKLLGYKNGKPLHIAFGNDTSVYEGIEIRTGIKLFPDPINIYIVEFDDMIIYINKTSSTLTKQMLLNAFDYYESNYYKTTSLSSDIKSIIIYTDYVEESIKDSLEIIIPDILCISPNISYVENYVHILDIYLPFKSLVLKVFELNLVKRKVWDDWVKSIPMFHKPESLTEIDFLGNNKHEQTSTNMK